MNPTNEDATRPIPTQGGSGAPSNDGDSKIAALKGEVTSRIAAVKNGSDTPKSSSRTSKGATGDQQPSARTSHAPSGKSAVSAGSANTADKARGGTGRRVRLTLSRIDPWSVMKFSFLVAVAVGIATVIATALLWNIVDSVGLWDQINSIGKDLNNNKPLPFMEYFEFTKMISYSMVVAFLNVIIITALGTLLAFLYNIVAALLGGIKVTFTDN